MWFFRCFRSRSRSTNFQLPWGVLQGCTRWECSPDRGYQPHGSHSSWRMRLRGDAGAWWVGWYKQRGRTGKPDHLGCHFDEKHEERNDFLGYPIVWTPMYLIENSCDSAVMLVKRPHTATSHATNCSGMRRAMKMQRLGFQLPRKRRGHS